MKHAFLVALPLLLSACTDADVVSKNLSNAADYFEINRRIVLQEYEEAAARARAADYFEINRRIVFYNGITGDYMLTIEGLCSRGNQDQSRQLTIVCKTGPNSYKKHFLGLSDNVTYFIEQMEPAQANAYHYRVVFKPATIVPDLEIR